MRIFPRLVIGMCALFLGAHFVNAQNVVVRELRQPSLTQEPLTDDTEAARMFYLSLGAVSALQRNINLKGMGLADAEVVAVSAQAANFKTVHDANAAAFSAQAMRTKNTKDDRLAYQGTDDGLLQQLQTSLSTKLSEASAKALSTEIEKQKIGMKTYRFVFEVPTESSPITNNIPKIITPKFKTASYHLGGGGYPICPGGQGPYHILIVTGTVSGSNTLGTTDGTTFSMTMAANGTYSESYSQSLTCTNPYPDYPAGFKIELDAAFNNGSGNFTTQGSQQSAVSPPACFHETEGPINVSNTAYTDSFVLQEGIPMPGTTDFKLLQIAISGLIALLAENANKIDVEIAFTWSIQNGTPQNLGPLQWVTPISQWCDTAHIPPDFNPPTATTTLFPSQAGFYSDAACFRYNDGTSKSSWICGPGLIKSQFSPTTLGPQACTHNP